jgi:hypothetical protein
MYFDLADIISPISDLNEMHEPFAMEEIDNIVANFPTRKSLGPDGFNSDFMKAC